jgi:hypothetical protein
VSGKLVDAAFGDFVSRGLLSGYDYYIEVPPTRTSITIELFDADVGAGGPDTSTIGQSLLAWTIWQAVQVEYSVTTLLIQAAVLWRWLRATPVKYTSLLLLPIKPLPRIFATLANPGDAGSATTLYVEADPVITRMRSNKGH